MTDTDPKKMKCTPLNGQSLGDLCYLSTYYAWADVVTIDHAELLHWHYDEPGGGLYLRAAHHLGNQDGQAHWGGSPGVKLDYNADGSISLADSPSRKLYYKDWPNDNDRKAVYWTNGESHPNILKFESGLVVTHDCRLTSPNCDTSGAFWEHSMDAGTTWKVVPWDHDDAVCTLEIPHDAIRLKLKIHNNLGPETCNKTIRVYVYDKDGNIVHSFDPLSISRGEHNKYFVFDVSGDALPYKTGGVYLDEHGKEYGSLPDPKFTITRKSGG